MADENDPRAPAPVTVLFVDDEPDILASYEVLFAAALRVRVLVAPSGAAALELLRREAVDLIVSDFRMPGMTGIEFLARAKELAPGVPRILFTAFDDPAMAAEARRAGVVGVVTKAENPLVMIELVRGFLPRPAANHRPPPAPGGSGRAPGAPRRSPGG